MKFKRSTSARKKVTGARCVSCSWAHFGNRSKRHMHGHLAALRGHTVELVFTRTETWTTA